MDTLVPASHTGLVGHRADAHTFVAGHTSVADHTSVVGHASVVGHRPVAGYGAGHRPADHTSGHKPAVAHKLAHRPAVVGLGRNPGQRVGPQSPAGLERHRIVVLAGCT